MYNKQFMLEAMKCASLTSRTNIGGPFGCCIVKDDNIICTRSNSVLETHDPTCHAELNAIRSASIKLGTYNLSDCELYTTGFPCPMCLGAIMWAGIKTVYVSGTLEDAEKIGFKDKFIYETIDKLNKKCYNTDVLELEFHDNDVAQILYNQYQENNKTIY